MNKKEILIIEDDSRFRKSIQHALKSEGYVFIEAESVREAIDKFREYPTARVILLDLSLPDGSGRDFLEQIDEPSNYRVIVLTGHEEYLAAEKARDFSVFRYLPKASKSFTESLRFSVAQAFIDIENEYLKNKNKIVIEIQKKINTEILESTSIDQTLKSLDEILTLICKSVINLAKAYTCHIRLYSLSRGELSLVAFAGPEDEVKIIFNDPDGWFSVKVAKSKKTEIYPDLQNNEDFKSFKEKKLKEVESLNNASLFKSVENYFTTVKSAYITPITTRMFDDETDAVFNVSGDSIDFFSGETQEIIKEFVTLATTAITKAWQKKRKVESHLDYKGVSEVLEEISKELKGVDVEDKIYEKFLEGVSKIIKPETISVFLHNKRTNLLDDKAEFRGNKRVPPRKEGHPLHAGLTGRVFKDRKPIRIPNLQDGDRTTYQQHEDHSKELEEKYIGEIPSGRINHYLGVPMFIGKDIIGVVQLINKKSAYYKNPDDKEKWLLERGFSNDCENVLGIAASHLAVSIRNAELFEERNRKINQLETLKDIGKFISAEMPLDDLLEEIIKEAAADVQAEICLMFLLNENNDKVILEKCYGISKSVLEGANYEKGEGLTGKVALTGKSELEEAGEPTGKYDKQIIQRLKEIGRSTDIESLMIVPIKAKDKVLGVIKAINKKGEGEQYNEDDLVFFEALASNVGIAIENARRYELASQKLAAAESNSMLSNLVASVAHEVNHTYGLIPDDILEIKELLVDSDYEISQILARIENLVMRMVYYSNEIKGYYIGEIGEKQSLDIKDVIETAKNQIPAFRKPDNFDSIKLKLDLFEEPIMCRLYENPLVQSIRNIVANAYQALENIENGEIIIKTSKNDNNTKAIIEIADNGCGIEEEYKSKIFDYNFTTKTGKGSGIGLWLAKRHIESMSGSISFKSIKNQGTTFILEIPLDHEIE